MEVELFANNGDPDQMPHSAASDLDLQCLQITLQGVSRLQWINMFVEMYLVKIQTMLFIYHIYCGPLLFAHD